MLLQTRVIFFAFSVAAFQFAVSSSSPTTTSQNLQIMVKQMSKRFRLLGGRLVRSVTLWGVIKALLFSGMEMLSFARLTNQPRPNHPSCSAAEERLLLLGRRCAVAVNDFSGPYDCCVSFNLHTQCSYVATLTCGCCLWCRMWRRESRCLGFTTAQQNRFMGNVPNCLRLPPKQREAQCKRCCWSSQKRTKRSRKAYMLTRSPSIW